MHHVPGRATRLVGPWVGCDSEGPRSFVAGFRPARCDQGYVLFTVFINDPPPPGIRVHEAGTDDIYE